MSRRQTWIGVLVVIAVLLVISTVPGHADRGGHGYKGGMDMEATGMGSRAAGRHQPAPRRPLRSLREAILGALSYPPVVMAPSPQVSVEPSPLPPQYWYYCDAAQAYYPYVQECPGEWRPVLPTPPG